VNNAGTRLFRDFDGAVAAATIGDDDFVGSAALQMFQQKR
jgi:hypothetical protein